MFILYDPQTGKICRASGQDIDTYPEHLTKLEIDYEGRPDLQLIKLDLETKQIVSVDNVNEITQQRRVESVRRLRNAMLKQSDWTQLADVSLTEASKAEWAAYRQQLRDITDTLPNPIPENYRPTWPIQPSNK